MAEPKKETTDRTWFYVAGSFVVLWCVYLAFFGPRGDEALNHRPRLDTGGLFGQADYGWTVFDLDGKPVEFSRFRGKAVFLNLWATWCPPCLEEMPSIARLAANPRLKDVAFVCVSTDENPALLKRFVAAKSWPMTILRASGLPSVFLTDGLPATYLIAPDGRVVVAEQAPARWDAPEVVAFLETLAKSPRR